MARGQPAESRRDDGKPIPPILRRPYGTLVISYLPVLRNPRNEFLGYCLPCLRHWLAPETRRPVSQGTPLFAQGLRAASTIPPGLTGDDLLASLCLCGVYHPVRSHSGRPASRHCARSSVYPAHSHRGRPQKDRRPILRRPYGTLAISYLPVLRNPRNEFLGYCPPCLRH